MLAETEKHFAERPEGDIQHTSKNGPVGLELIKTVYAALEAQAKEIESLKHRPSRAS